jgi:hypothetical protein
VYAGGTAGCVVAATDGSGRECVLKIAMPLDEEEREAFTRSVGVHRIADGRGCAELYDYVDDSPAPAMLLERLGPNLHESGVVGQMTDLDKLVIEVETNGVITPNEAIVQASEILVDHFMVLAGKDVCTSPECEEEGACDEGGDILIEEINLSPRTTNALLNNDIKTVADILKLTDGELRTLKGFGSKAYDEVKEKLEELGFEGLSE